VRVAVAHAADECDARVVTEHDRRAALTQAPSTLHLATLQALW
jgi:hypothetical protein